MLLINTIQFLGALELGLIYAFVAIGVYLTFRTLQFPDLTVDGSFPLGASVCAMMISSGFNPVLATFCALLAGAAAGLLTALLATKLKMLNLLAGIVTATGLYSINLRIMGGKPNISLLGDSTIFSYTTNHFLHYPFLIGLTLIFMFLIYSFLKTKIGLAIRATGINPKMARAQGINDHKMIWLGLSISNGLVALAGAFFSQINGYADVTMGVGTIIMGLASVIIGEAIFNTRTVFMALFACITGAIIYRLVIAMALNFGEFGLSTSDNQLVTAILVSLAMFLPTIKQKINNKKRAQV